MTIVAKHYGAHQAGTIRFETDPAAAALDLDCKAYDIDNLYVVDGSPEAAPLRLGGELSKRNFECR